MACIALIRRRSLRSVLAAGDVPRQTKRQLRCSSQCIRFIYGSHLDILDRDAACSWLFELPFSLRPLQYRAVPAAGCARIRTSSVSPLGNVIVNLNRLPPSSARRTSVDLHLACDGGGLAIGADREVVSSAAQRSLGPGRRVADIVPLKSPFSPSI